MINDDNLIHSLNVLIERENNKHNEAKSMFSSYYDALKKTLIDSNGNEFAKNVIVNSFYSVLKNENFIISDLINDAKFISVLSDYTSFKENFENKYSDKIDDIINRFKDVCNVGEILNQSDIASYVITESLIDYTLSTKRFVSRTNVDEKSEHSTILHGQFLRAYKENDVIKKMNGKPYGFYIFKTQYKELISSTRNLSDIYIVSNQKCGITIFSPHCKLLGRCGLTNSSFSLSHLINKDHDVKLELKESNSNDISIYNGDKKNDFDELQIINKLVLKSFISLASNKDELNKVQKENKALVFKTSEKINKENLPAIMELENEESHKFSFDEMRFTGKYAFMSHLDDIFADFIDMDIVNLRTKNTTTFYYLDRKSEENRSKHIEPTVATVEEFKRCYSVKEVELEGFSVGMHRQRGFLSPLTETMIGSKVDILKKSKKSALMNKLSLVDLLIDLYHIVHFEKLRSQLESFFIENFEVLSNDERFLKLITDVGVSKSTQPNHYNIGGYYGTTFVSNEKEQLNDYDNGDKMKNYTLNRKATNLMAMPIYDYRIIDLLVSEYGLTLCNKSQDLVKIQKIKNTLDEMYKAVDIHKKTRINFYCFFDNGIDIELNSWFGRDLLSYLIIPVSKNQCDEFTMRMNKLKGDDFVQNCNNRDGRKMNIKLGF